MTDTITTTQMLKALESMCDTIETEKDYLSDLDGAIGDGDQTGTRDDATQAGFDARAAGRVGLERRARTVCGAQ